MASRLGGRIFAQAVRPSVRGAARTTGRRGMSSSGHAAKSSDTPWIIGSAVVFGPAAVWLLLPQSNKKTHDVAFSQADRGAHTVGESKQPEPAQEPEPSSGEKTSADSKDTNSSEEEKKPEDGSLTDAEGETISAKEVNESMEQSFNEDSPVDAQTSEEKQAKDDKGVEGAPEAETKPDPKDKPSEKKGDESPSDLGDARKTSKDGEAPKQSDASK
ncbi:hypothetical protein FOMPIDRAFT_1025004 [Fomitopsis schrenkii]|uniref:Uncharacterized protein n=1 Tax=Fomitopsis schrenkii TaxID=2126942 RepID=S8DWQ0_FOMSC|nr:hypothetical protein FOMPIDRAFT_1025004 [Fomitopsis schrenkii]